MIKINNLKISFNSVVVLNNINIEIKKGEKVFLLGPSGVGKTSILESLLIKNHEKGMVEINGIVVSNLKRKSRRNISKNISFISQSDNFIDDKTVFNNLYRLMKPKNKFLKLIGIPTKEDINKIYTSLKKLKIETKAQTLISELSGGERKRAQIVLSFLNKAEITIADEPTSSLDIKNSKNIIQEIMKSKNTVMIAVHKLNLISLGDRIIGFKNKKIQFDTYLTSTNMKMVKELYE